MAHIAIVIDWFGPYDTLEAAQTALRSDYGAGLYLAIGKQARQRGRSTMQYVGISKELSSRVGSLHHKLGTKTRSRSSVIGITVSTTLYLPRMSEHGPAWSKSRANHSLHGIYHCKLRQAPELKR